MPNVRRQDSIGVHVNGKATDDPTRIEFQSVRLICLSMPPDEW